MRTAKSYVSLSYNKEPEHSISYKIVCAPSEDSDQLRIRAVWIESL